MVIMYKKGGDQHGHRAVRRRTTPLGSWLTRRREQNDESQKELGRRAGVSAQVIHCLEVGRYSNPTAKVVYALAQALGVPAEEILKRCR